MSATATAQTIIAPATGAGRSGVAVLRVSGVAALPLAAALTQKPATTIKPRTAYFCNFSCPLTGQQIDEGLLLYFPAPHSFTGEDVVEFQVHGGRAVIEAMMAAALSFTCDAGGIRLAAAGEFTRRAFENDKLDLTKAEAIADLVNAETAAQHQQALRQMAGELGVLYENWAAQITKVLAHLEAYLDFPDEPLPPELATQHEEKITELMAAISGHLTTASRGQRLRDGIRIALVGAPNAGKSSLLNALAARNAAIISPTAGTTRDVIEVALDMGGFPLLLQDTAGLRDTVDDIEQEGMRRALLAAAAADMVIWLIDSSLATAENLAAEAMQIWPAIIANTGSITHAPSLLIALNKQDIAPADRTENLINHLQAMPAFAQLGKSLLGIQTLSAATGFGAENLKEIITQWCAENYQPAALPSLTRLRHATACEQALNALVRAQTAPTPELVAEDLRLAWRALKSITGTADVDELLDVIFRDFCIGNS